VAGVTRSLTVLVVLAAAAFTAAAAFGAAGDPKIVIKPADQAHAKTILLKASEVDGKGWKGTPADFGRANPICVIKHYSLSKLTANAQTGIEFTRPVDTGTFLVDSDAYVFRTPAEAKTAAVTVSKIGYGKCLGAALVSQAPNGSIATSSVKALTVRGLAVPATGFRITVKVITGGKTSVLTADVLAFRHGRAVSTLSALTIDKGWSTAALRSAAGKMASRTARV
jgi:hypothetical protein